MSTIIEATPIAIPPSLTAPGEVGAQSQQKLFLNSSGKIQHHIRLIQGGSFELAGAGRDPTY